MKIEKMNFSAHPERITTETFDCVWVRLKARSQPSPLQSEPLQWVDWKLQGQLSRFLLDPPPSGSGGNKITFVPTMKKVSFPILALQTELSMDWTAFIRNCEGMKMKAVLIFCEEASGIDTVERELRRLNASGYPEKITLATTKAAD